MHKAVGNDGYIRPQVFDQQVSAARKGVGFG